MTDGQTENTICRAQGCHASGKSQEKIYFFKVRELSGNLKKCQGNSEKGEMSGNFM